MNFGSSNFEGPPVPMMMVPASMYNPVPGGQHTQQLQHLQQQLNQLQQSQQSQQRAQQTQQTQQMQQSQVSQQMTQLQRQLQQLQEQQRQEANRKIQQPGADQSQLENHMRLMKQIQELQNTCN